MGLDLRRRILLAQVNSRGLDGRDCIAVGSNGYCYYSTDYGVNWSRCPGSWSGVSHAYIARSKSVPVNTATPFWFTAGTYAYFARIGSNYTTYTNIGATLQMICCSGDGSIAFTSYNAGSSWQTGYQTYIQKITRSSETACSAATKGSFSSWDQTGPGEADCSLNGQYAVVGGATGYTNAFQSRNYGETWTECLATQSFGNGTSFVACTVTGAEWSTGGPSSGQNISSDYLASWYHEAIPDSGRRYGGCFAGSTPSDVIFYVTTPSGLYVWDQISRGSWPAQTYTRINSTVYTEIKCNYTGNKLIGLLNGYIYYSHNWGRTWHRASTPSGVTFTEIGMTKYA